jgi:glycosyltransferase involved in cell wall biosynthesis
MKSGSILFVDQFREVAGGQVVLQALVAAALRDGRQVGVLAPRGGRLEADLRALAGDAVELHDLEELRLNDGRKSFGDLLRYLLFIATSLRFRRLAARYETIHVNGGRLAAPFLFLSLFLPTHRWIYHVHLCHTRLEKWLLAVVASSPTTHRVVAASSFIRDDLVLSVPRLAQNRRLTVLENCLPAAFARLSFSDRSRRAGTLQVALIGRVSPEKGHQILPKLARRFPRCHFSMIGRTTPENEAFLQTILRQAPPNLTYAGETSDLPAFLEQHNIHVSLVPSRWDEPFGLTAIESAAASCLTVVSDRGMLPLIAQRTGADCFRDFAGLVEIFARITAMTPEERATLARLQHAKTLRHFGPETFQKNFLRLLEPDDEDRALSPAGAAV